jgi:hypothetical protein
LKSNNSGTIPAKQRFCLIYDEHKANLVALIRSFPNNPLDSLTLLSA